PLRRLTELRPESDLSQISVRDPVGRGRMARPLLKHLRDGSTNRVCHMEFGFRKAALAAAALLVLTAGGASVDASQITVPVNIPAGGSLTLGVNVNPNGLDLIGFDFGFSLPASLAITSLTAGSLLPSGSLAAFFLLPL